MDLLELIAQQPVELPPAVQWILTVMGTVATCAVLWLAKSVAGLSTAVAVLAQQVKNLEERVDKLTGEK